MNTSRDLDPAVPPPSGLTTPHLRRYRCCRCTQPPHFSRFASQISCLQVVEINGQRVLLVESEGAVKAVSNKWVLPACLAG